MSEKGDAWNLQQTAGDVEQTTPQAAAIKRYDVFVDKWGNWEPDENGGGEFVKYTDHAQALARAYEEGVQAGKQSCIGKSYTRPAFTIDLEDEQQAPDAEGT